MLSVRPVIAQSHGRGPVSAAVADTVFVPTFVMVTVWEPPAMAPASRTGVHDESTMTFWSAASATDAVSTVQPRTDSTAATTATMR